VGFDAQIAGSVLRLTAGCDVVLCGSGANTAGPERGIMRPMEREGESAAGEYPAVESDFARQYDKARSLMAGLRQTPTHPERWLRELCRRMSNGSPPEAAAARIPLDWTYM
jgi:hypothetical protein